MSEVNPFQQGKIVDNKPVEDQQADEMSAAEQTDDSVQVNEATSIAEVEPISLEQKLASIRRVVHSEVGNSRTEKVMAAIARILAE